MGEKKKYIVIILLILVVFGLVKIMINRAIKTKPEGDDFEVIEETNHDTLVGKQAEKVSGYHLVTYDQSSNADSFIKTIEVEATKEAPVKFVIGSIDDDFLVEERTSFTLDCKQGENRFNLSEDRHFIKKGEYLLMDIQGQDTLYTEEENGTHSLVQHERNRKMGEMFLTQSDYILPFTYQLEKVKEYHCLVIGNEITTNNHVQGLDATDMEHDYYHLTKTRLENTFEKVTMERINLVPWEKSLETAIDKKTIQPDAVKNLDLTIIQLGENFDSTVDVENKMLGLVEYIQKYSPNCEIIWMSGWNMDATIWDKMIAICERQNLEFISFADLYEKDYKSLATTSFFESEDQAIYYPNNEAMQIISNRIIELLKFDF